MSKAVILSIRPEWCEKILSGKKTIEIRKTKPQLMPPFAVYVYCTKAPKGWLNLGTGQQLDGHVIAEFTCDKIITVDCDSVAPFDKNTKDYIEKDSCVDRKTLWKYTKGFCAYGWHISDLRIFDKPMELSNFTGLKQTRFGGMPYKLSRPPQSWCYAETIM